MDAANERVKEQGLGVRWGDKGSWANTGLRAARSGAGLGFGVASGDGRSCHFELVLGMESVRLGFGSRCQLGQGCRWRLMSMEAPG